MTSGSGARDGRRFDITVTDGDEATSVVALHGEIDIDAAEAVRQSVDKAASEAQSVVLDLTAVTFMDSTGLRMLLEAREDHGDRVRVGGRSARVDRVIEVSGLGPELGV
jgi:anti-sigma B factor antagonist